MEQPLIQALSKAQPLIPTYIQAVNGIQSYSKWVITQSLSDVSLNNTLQQMRIHAGAWYNSIYPQYLNMPADISSASTSVNNDLSTLLTLAQQEKQTPGSPALQQQVSQYANSLIATIQGFLSQVQGLTSVLTTFQQNLKGDAALISPTEGSITATTNALQQQFSAANGQLQSLESATCPNKGDITSVGNTIVQIKTQLSQSMLATQLFDEAAYLINGAIIGSHYLTGYWTGVCSDIQACITGLQNIATQQGAILQVDLQAAQGRWKAILSNFTQMSNQLQTS